MSAYETETVRKIKEGFVGQKMVVLPPDSIKSLKKGVMTAGFYITAIGYYPNAHYHDRKRASGSKEYILLYCIKGCGSVTVEDQSYNLQPNTFIIIPPKTPHHYRSDIEDPWTIYWMHFKGVQADYLYNRFTKTAPRGIQEIPFSQKNTDEFKEAINLLTGEFDQNSLDFSCILIKSFISHLLYNNRNTDSNQEDSLVKRAREYLKTHLDQPIKIEALSGHFNLSVSRFTELYKAETGYSPIQHLILFRIQKSCQYLYFTDLSVKEITRKVGFEDPFYFSRMFKKLMGIAPTFYKKQNKK